MYFTNQQNIRKSEFHFPYQQQHASETAKDVETCKGMHFYRTQLMAVHNTVDENKMQVPPPPHGGDTQEIVQAVENNKPMHYKIYIINEVQILS